ncbi:MAG: GntR family transcriptional regulator [Candidatus Izemoplasmatales bacterium]|jgi:GntR family transcriptional regulator
MKNIVVRNTSQTPIYQQIYEQLSSQIMNGDLKPNQLLPSIRTAAKELRVSIITIKKTWEMLENKGLIYTVQGKGSYVKEYTQGDLDEKKLQTIKAVMAEAIVSIKSFGLSKEKIIEIINEVYDEKLK